jgi:hypothetical protein
MAKGEDGTDPVGEFVENSGLVDGMVTGWVLFVYYIDPESGEACYYGDAMEGQGSIVTLGLVEACASIEREQIIRQHFDDDDD